MERADIVKLASLLDDLGAAGREGVEELSAEMNSYHDKTNLNEALCWLAEVELQGAD